MTKITPELRCIHRHTIDEHPKCFAKGLIKHEFSSDREFEKLTGLPWYQMPGTRIGYFDIETSGFDADFSTVLTWAIKEKGGDIATASITRQELFDGEEDFRIVKDFVNAIREYDIIIGYYSTNFDLPYMRSKALHHGLDFPGYGELKHWDLFYTVKSKLKLSRSSLDAACDYLGISGKTHIDREAWRKGKYGDPKSLEYILTHNREDVKILEMLHDKIEFTRKWIRKSV